MKTCKATNCNNPVWGKGYCKYHQSLRTDKKPAKAIRKPTGERNLFDHVIATSNLKCSLRPHIDLRWMLNTDGMIYSCCAHILPKGKYPLFRLYRPNVVLIHVDRHHIWDNHRYKITRDPELRGMFMYMLSLEAKLIHEYEIVKQYYHVSDFKSLNWESVTNIIRTCIEQHELMLEDQKRFTNSNPEDYNELP